MTNDLAALLPHYIIVDISVESKQLILILFVLFVTLVMKEFNLTRLLHFNFLSLFTYLKWGKLLGVVDFL